ncbi:VOC family protein [Nocardia sp. NPDC057455]|uniref:VOC family protein n=1 Tax=Nocardia sp. NPDC057455 TaxID=3346138 RepID=UPI00366F4024
MPGSVIRSKRCWSPWPNKSCRTAWTTSPPVPRAERGTGCFGTAENADLAAAQGTLIFTTDAVDATFARLRDADVQVTQEPISQPYGVRDCGFRDPWGNHLRFSEILG